MSVNLTTALQGIQNSITPPVNGRRSVGVVLRDNLSSTWAVDQFGNIQVSGTVSKLSRITLTEPASSITFSDIPQTFTDLEISCQSIGDAGNVGLIGVQFNGDTGLNYTFSFMYNGEEEANYTVNASGNNFHDPGAGSGYLGFIPNAVIGVGYAGVAWTRIYEYASSAFWKSALGFSYNVGTYVPSDSQSNNNVTQFGIGWQSYAPITSITLFPCVGPSLSQGGNFIAGSTFNLYGVQ